MDATLLNYMCLSVGGLLQSLQWYSSVGCNSQSLSRVEFYCGAVSTNFSMVFQCTLQVFVGSPGGIPVYTESTSGIPVVFQRSLPSFLVHQTFKDISLAIWWNAFSLKYCSINMGVRRNPSFCFKFTNAPKQLHLSHIIISDMLRQWTAIESSLPGSRFSNMGYL